MSHYVFVLFQAYRMEPIASVFLALNVTHDSIFCGYLEKENLARNPRYCIPGLLLLVL